MKLTKVTEVVGEHISNQYENEFIESEALTELGKHLVELPDLLPPGSHGKRGTWRITVEFEPEET